VIGRADFEGPKIVCPLKCMDWNATTPISPESSHLQLNDSVLAHLRQRLTYASASRAVSARRSQLLPSPRKKPALTLKDHKDVAVNLGQGRCYALLLSSVPSLNSSNLPDKSFSNLP